LRDQEGFVFFHLSRSRQAEDKESILICLGVECKESNYLQGKSREGGELVERLWKARLKERCTEALGDYERRCE